MTSTSTQDRHEVSTIVDHDHEEQVAALDTEFRQHLRAMMK